MCDPFASEGEGLQIDSQDRTIVCADCKGNARQKVVIFEINVTRYTSVQVTMIFKNHKIR